MKEAFIHLSDILDLGELSKGYKLYFKSSKYQNSDCWSRAESTTQSRLEMTNFSRSEIANAAADSFLLRF